MKPIFYTFTFVFSCCCSLASIGVAQTEVVSTSTSRDPSTSNEAHVEKALGASDSNPNTSEIHQNTLGEPTAAASSSKASNEESEYEYSVEHQGVGIEIGLQFGSPIWATLPAKAPPSNPSDGDVRLNPGFLGLLRIGYEVIPGLLTEIQTGGLVNTVQDGNGSLMGSLLVGAAVRYAILNRTMFVPYVSAHGQINFWEGRFCLSEEEQAESMQQGGFSVARCSTRFNFKSSPTFVFGGSLGNIFELTSSFGLELGARFDVSLPGTVFSKMQFFVSPYLGTSFYF